MPSIGWVISTATARVLPRVKGRRAREESYPLLELQDLLALLLDEHTPEDVAEEADVAP